MQPHILLGLFALLSVLLAGAAIGCSLGLTAGERVYVIALTLAVVAWLTGRRARRQEDCP